MSHAGDLSCKHADQLNSNSGFTSSGKGKRQHQLRVGVGKVDEAASLTGRHILQHMFQESGSGMEASGRNTRRRLP